MKAEWTNKDVLTQSETTGQSRAILVIDMPSSCATCEIRWGCKIWDRWKGYDDRLDGCPLKPMPREKSNYDFMGDYEIMEAMGWNACIKEIEGE